MKDKDWLVQKYGEPTALQIIKTKKDLEAKRGPHDPAWVMANPDVPDSEVSYLVNRIQSFYSVGFVKEPYQYLARGHYRLGTSYTKQIRK